jgi:hypothetical protein
MRKLLASLLSVALLLLPLAGAQPAFGQQNPPSNQSFVGGKFVAKNYIYPGIRITSGNSTGAGAATFGLSSASIRLPDGRTVMPFSAGGLNILGQPGPFPAIPIYVGAGATRELVTPTAVTGCFAGAPQGSCQITATFANAHGQGEVVTSGSFGIQEAANDAGFWGGGVVSVDPSLNFVAGSVQTITTAMAATNVVPGVTLEDDRSGPPTFWNVVGGAAALATPAILTAVTALPSATPVGAFGTGTYHMCIAYVDIMGQEGNCSLDFSQAGLATGSFIFSPPAASTNAVGFTIYIGLTGGGVTNLDYKVPLITQPTVVGAYPVANGVCTLTTVETVTPACSVANTLFGQTGATATVTAITLNTSQINPETTIISTTSIYVPNPGGRTTYTYAPASSVGAGGDMPSSELAFPITAAAATTVPAVAGTINLPPQYMNVLGKKIEICGEITATASTATIIDIQMQWDANGQNTAGKGVLIGDMTATPAAAIATAGHYTFCQDFETTVVSASATGGSINHVNSYGAAGGITAVAPGALSDAVTPGAIGSLNLADSARINIIYLHQIGTDGAGVIAQNITIKQM